MQKVTAVCWVGSSRLSAENSYIKTHPLQEKYGGQEKIFLHAEIALLVKLVRQHPKSIERAEIHVERHKKDGSLGMAKPCRSCQAALAAFGIGKVTYTNEKGEKETLW